MIPFLALTARPRGGLDGPRTASVRPQNASSSPSAAIPSAQHDTHMVATVFRGLRPPASSAAHGPSTPPPRPSLCPLFP